MSPDPFAGRIAHSASAPGGSPQWLVDHLRGVAARASEFAGAFGAAQIAELAGQWHDIGKAAEDWQEYIRSAGDLEGTAVKGPPHAPLGAIHAAEVMDRGYLREVLGLVISGHHGGLSSVGNLKEQRSDEVYQTRYSRLGLELSKVALDPPPGFENPTRHETELLTRMVFSALVDADFLDTEAYLATAGSAEAEANAEARQNAWPTLPQYQQALERFLDQKQRTSPDTPVNRLRREVLAACTAAAEQASGAFTLTVPTGGGKTLSSLAFAVRHALGHGKRRIIISLPFTSIIDQTADVLREIFTGLGGAVLLEHHSAVDPRSEQYLARVAAENWDAPLIVTTQVQLFESLFANRSSRCRKIHRIANSVLILDEVQSLPHGLLSPILDVLDELVKHYGVTLLLMTATQPGLHSRTIGATRFDGLHVAPTEIVPPALHDELWSGLRRVQVTWPSLVVPPVPDDGFWSGLATELLTHPQVLAIVHLKRDAQALHRALVIGDPDALHLSAAMCPTHRRLVLRQVRERLAAGRPCRVVSTQVIEAGVDVDFPVVYRALAGLESLAQSAGRCNREGRLPSPGQFRVFVSPSRPPQTLRTQLDTAREMLHACPDLDLLVPGTFAAYFDRLYARRDLDVHQVQVLRKKLDFRETALAFRMIDDLTDALIIPWDDRARKRIQRLERRGPSREVLRSLQPYSVSIYGQQRAALLRQGALREVHGILLLADLTPNSFYDDALGLLTEADASKELIA